VVCFVDIGGIVKPSLFLLSFHNDYEDRKSTID